MNDPIRKEILTQTVEGDSRTDTPGYYLKDGEKATIFAGENIPAGQEYIVTPETYGQDKEGETHWDFIEGRFYRYKDCTNPDVAKTLGENIPPALYVIIKPVDPEDFNNTSSMEDIEHAIGRVLYKWAGMDYRNPSYGLSHARYLEKARQYLVRVEPKSK